MRVSTIRLLAGSALILAALVSASHGLEYVKVRQNDKEVTLQGKLVVQADDGGLMLLTADGQLHSMQPADFVSRRSDDLPLVPLKQEQVAKELLATLPAGFEVHTTARYVILHNTSRAYAQWCGALFERLYAGFVNFWKNKGFTLHEPEFPLVCIVFADQASYERWAKAELGEATRNVIAYYSLKTNLVTMYDLTGTESLRRANDRRGSAAQINQMLAQPNAEKMVATIVHEATHQIAYNCGLQTRFADIPLWVSEGIAVYFEAPDLSNSKGWRSIGEVNRLRIGDFRKYTMSRPSESLKSLIVDDKRFRDPRQAVDAYAEAWALNYFLIRQKPKEYKAYMQLMATKQPLIWSEPAERLKEFQDIFGDLSNLDADFLKYMRKVR